MSLPLVVARLRAELSKLVPRAASLGLSESEAWNVLVVLVLRDVLRHLSRARGRDAALLQGGRLFLTVPSFAADERGALRSRLASQVEPPRLPDMTQPWAELPIEAFGQLYESLLAARPSDTERNLRKRTGSYYTPEPLTRLVVERAFSALEPSLGASGVTSRALRVLDPALGAGAFLVQAGRETARRSGRALDSVVKNELFGVDVSPLAVAVAEASLWLLADAAELRLAAAGANLREADALCGLAAASTLERTGIDFRDLVGDAQGFDVVLGNPPWVAFAGRATQPLSPALRDHYRRTFRAFKGYPTLHGLFVELAATLAPRGVVALLIPSPVADLAGYRHVRRALRESHAVCEPLLELGQDAFESVTQPCFALVARPRADSDLDLERPFVLSERSRAGAQATELRVPAALTRLASLPRFPPELFGEMGFQTNSRVTRELLYRGSTPPPEHSYALLEGRDVVEFRVRAPRLFLRPDPDVLLACRCRLRAAEAFARVKLVVRQTAAITIAALHDGTPFRNSLLAVFSLPDFPAELVLGLLNSQLYRALHLAGRRDARQTTFPQVKVAHLRALPAPVRRSSACSEIARLAAEASRTGLTVELRRALDAVVFAAFEVEPHEAAEITDFVARRAPRAGLVVPPGSGS